MKLSNFLLTFVACGTVWMAWQLTSKLTQYEPTSVLSIEDTVSPSKEDNFVIKLPARMTDHQSELIETAYNISKEDGFRYPKLLPGILLQESKAGNMSSYKVAGAKEGLAPNKRYYGVAQIKLAAARDVLNKYPNLWKEFKFQTKTDEEIIAKLILDDNFNIAVASKYLIILQSQGFKTPKAIALAYNRGAGGALSGFDPHNYSASVIGHMQKVSVATIN